MSDLSFGILLASVLATAAPLIIAALGETLTEKAGVINLSLDGSLLLSAMVAFMVAYESGSFMLAFASAAATAAAVAALVGIFGIYLGQHAGGDGRRRYAPLLRTPVPKRVLVHRSATGGPASCRPAPSA